VCILKGASFFATELAKRITVPVMVDFMATSSYGAGTVSTGNVKVTKELDLDPSGHDVLIVEDIIDSGNTLNFLKGYFENKNASSVKLCTMLDKPDRREIDVNVDYTGFSIPDEFVIGYGLDYDQKYRNLPYIGVMEFEP
jgi:hypoxanthine phosphoribosyltransferase